MPSLRVFRAMDIDPLCYPDDISLLFLASKQLQDIRLHFSPRMRQVAEATLSLETYWGRCWKASYTPPLKHLAMQNWFGSNSSGMGSILDLSNCASMAFLDTFGGAQGGSANVYIDDTWRNIPRGTETPHFRTIKFNEFAEQHLLDWRKSTSSTTARTAPPSSPIPLLTIATASS
jgi:hypothetical protein